MRRWTRMTVAAPTWSGEEESRGESPRRVRELDGTSTDWESAEEGSSSGTEGIASTGTGDSGHRAGRAGLLTSSTPIDSWEVVFHAKKIGIQFKQGRGGRIVVSKLSELVLFDPSACHAWALFLWRVMISFCMVSLATSCATPQSNRSPA